MEEDSLGGEGGGGDPRPSPTASTRKGKSCKGCLYYSSLLKSDARNPMCFGISRSLPQVPGYIVGESEMEATKDGRSLSDFKYACVGYAVFLDNKDKSTEKGENQAELPFCAGIELLVDRRASNASHVPAHVHKEDATTRSQPRAYKPAHFSVEEFFSRFSRNAGLVASGVARNLNILGNYIKDHIDDILYPYRRRPK
ncbi:uncharacterized protein LOC103723386 isoform X2 [Phoenix dactylifera]|uniref:Uncharacterized protein LOC103723386 isoform X2 n=1 Tax=Phoenix dactylifera TaxID=42345 RepID=A0A8B7D3Q5_PHODC|nr:uncharacterized protein LOC103723386 isoform X2 [Phoenix dactylifera]